MKIKNITETTVAGGIAPVAAPMGKAIKRESVKVSGQEPVSKLLKKGGKMKRKGPYMNSPVLEGIQEGNKSDKLPPLKEASLSEEDIILVPGQSPRLKAGFHAHDPDKADHELETVKNSLKTIMRNAQELYSHLDGSTQFPEWVSEKIGQIKGMMTSVSDYMVSKQMPMSEEQGFNDHEISMARSEMRSAVKSAKKIYKLLGQRQNIMAWQQSYITLASDYLDSVADSMEQESADGVNEMTGGVIAAGGVGEGVEQQNLNLATPKYTNQYDMSLFDNPQRFWLKVHDWIDGIYLGDKKLRRELPGYIRWILNYSDMGKDKSKEQMGVYGVMNDIKKKWPETYGNLKYENKAKTLRMDIQTIVDLFLNGTIR